MSLKKFAIRSVRSLVLVKLSGEWSMSTDLSYLSELAEHIARVKARKYCVFVDMRGWQLEQPVAHEVAKTDVRFDRRSQKGECWLQATPQQANYLVKFFSAVRFPLCRTVAKNEVIEWARELVDEDLVVTLDKWIDTDLRDIEKIFPSN
ncbi:hypothetical protein OPS25_11310 [Alteromonas ponticola]|uniref:STAS/SEC14 domain-containing protein n=1 Tax=Alteromonas aquimaris TaxID=2998417 RepID=A0ABT3P8N2_9ALTE|nr:hypothetical protein [Alteromonas aquimaris]MCW8109084.1 hypothetical protein [Alteromonas aquimaris]